MPRNQSPQPSNPSDLSFFNYLQSELHRGYLLENDEERYTARREKVYTFFKIPRELEKFVAFGFFQCMDSFLFVLTFLPIRFLIALCWFFIRPFKRYLCSNPASRMNPAEIVDLLKGVLMIVCCYLISYIDTSVCYHIIKTQSTIKLYLFFNMLEIADRLMSAFGQDTLDALFWTATEPRDRKREHLGLIFHVMVASAYVALHSVIVLLQALCLNVAINSDNKGLLTIVISNNFIELKGAVFKKFDRNNLLQISCSDIRERFHLGVLLLVVVVQTMKEYSWKEERLWILLPDCFLVLGIEVLIDWLKHAFITRFNNIGVEAYRDYNVLIASDLIMCKQKYAYSDHSDLVARRMGFIPLPLGVVIFRIMSHALSINNSAGIAILLVGYLCLFTFRIMNGIVILGKACDLLNKADIQVTTRSRQPSENVEKGTEKSSSTNSPRKTSNSHLLPPPEQLEPLLEQEKPTIPSRPDSSRSVSSDSNLHHREMVQSVSKTEMDTQEVNDMDNQQHISESSTEVESSSSSPTIVESLCSDVEEGSDDVIDPLTFLGESESGLMTNSMVSLDSVGLGQNVNQVVNIEDDPVDVESISELTSMLRDINEDDPSKEIASSLMVPGHGHSKDTWSPPPFEATQSCPCFSKLIGEDQNIVTNSVDDSGVDWVDSNLNESLDKTLTQSDSPSSQKMEDSSIFNLSDNREEQDR